MSTTMRNDRHARAEGCIPGKGFTEEYWEKVWQDVTLPQQTLPSDIPELDACFHSHLQTEKGRTLIEIGCAPGRWMSYFAQQFHLDVSGVEYCEHACGLTVENLQYLRIPAEVHHADFFDFQHLPFDVVFSSGFIEHFPNVEVVLKRIVDLCKPGGLVITLIPNVGGGELVHIKNLSSICRCRSLSDQ